MTHVEFWAARLLRSRLPTVTTRIDGVASVVTVDFAAKVVDGAGVEEAAELRPAGVLIRVDADLPSVDDDEQLAAHALEVALAAANRVLHVAAFVGGSRGPVPVLGPQDVRDARCWEGEDEQRRELSLPKGEPPRARLHDASAADVQRVLDDARGSHRAEAEALWLDAVEAHYDGRYREAVVVARAAVEVAWKSYASAAATLYQKCTPAPARGAVFADYADRSLKWPLPERLDSACEVLLGFSFRTGWMEERWTKLCQMSDVRHATAHTGARPPLEASWTAIQLTREVLDKLAALGQQAGVS